MKKRFPFLLYLAIAAALFLALPRMASAQDDDNNEQDPPGRVARLNFIQGAISFQPSGEQDWVQANPNRPLTTGDNLWADAESRGELHIGSTTIRISSQTGISFLNLNDQQVQIQLAQGIINVRVRDIDQDEAYEIDTPNLAFSILRPGDYRFNVDPDGGTTVIVVRSGQGEVTGGGRAYTVTPGQRAIFSGSDELSYDVQPAGGLDEFDGWARSRDVREDHSESVRYVSRDVIGYEDLDTYGHWQPDRTYGNVWIPSNVEAGWAPYHNGHWAFISPWGWTWVEDEPWGFAPFHYGRWTVIEGGGWGWVPGPAAAVGVRTRVYYAPALVGFVGGGGVGVAIGFGGGVGVAWFPLGPRDVFVPAYHVSERYVTNVNVTNTTVINRVEITNVYRNVTVNHVTVSNYTYQRNTAAVTAVSRDTFVNARPVRSATIRVSAEEIQRPQVAQNAPALAPSRVSVVGPSAAASHTPPPALANRKLVTKMPPAPAATPIGRPRPSVNPALERANARINAGASGNANTNAARPGATAPPGAAPRPGNVAEPNRTNNPPSRSNENPAPANRNVTPSDRNNPTVNERSNPPNREAAPANRPNENPTQPNRATTPPNRTNPNANENANPPRREAPPAERPNDNAAQPNRNAPPPNRPNPNASENPPKREAPPANRPNDNATQPNRNAPPPNRPNDNAAQPNRNAPPPNRPNPNATENPPKREAPPPNRPNPNATENPPKREAPPANRPNDNAAQPNRNAPPNRANDNAARPQPNQPRPEPEAKPRPATPPPAARPQQKPPEPQPKPEAKPKPPDKKDNKDKEKPSNR